jgi:hypothetical protein
VGKRQILNCDDVLKAMRGGAAIFEWDNLTKNHPTWQKTREI